MSKASLEFSLPDERQEFEDAFYGGLYRAVLQDFAAWIDRQEGDGRQALPLEEAREELFKIAEDNGVTVWD